MSERLTLQDLVDLLSDKQNITKKDSETFLRELVSIISTTIETKDFVRIKDFGTFKLTPISARKSVDVNTGEAIEIPAHYRLSFTPDKVLREGVNRPFSHFESILLEDEVTFDSKPEVEGKSKPVEVAKKEEPKKALTKVTETKVEENKPEVEEIVDKPVQEEKVVETVEPEVTHVASEDTESLSVDNKIEEILQRTPDKADLNKNVVSEEELEKDEELSEIDSLISKGMEDKREVEPLVTNSDSSVRKEDKPTATRVSDQFDDDENDFVDYDDMAKKKKKRNLWIALALFFGVLVGVGFWGYNKFLSKPDIVPIAQNNDEIVIREDIVIPSDSAKKAAEVEQAIVKEMKEETTKALEAEASVSGGADKIIEVKSGQTMRALGLEYYGDGVFWVYIFEENRDKIAKPDAVFAGMKLNIASPEKYDINPKDPESKKKAKKLESKLFGEFSDK